MNRSAIAMSAALGLAVLAGCGNSSEPSAPPTSEDALTTTPPAVTSEPEPVETTDAEVTTEAPTADGPPEMPEEASEQTEPGAEAFVQHYIATLSAVHLNEADVDDLRALSADGCKSCEGFAAAAEQKRFGHPYINHISSEAVTLGDEARVETLIEQAKDGKRIDTVFTLIWEGDQWLVSEVQLSAQ